MHYTYSMKALSCLGAVLLLLTIPASAEDKKWAIHEWGTFTSLQNESGDALGGINSDDEPVPQFVHRLSFELLCARIGRNAGYTLPGSARLSSRRDHAAGNAGDLFPSSEIEKKIAAKMQRCAVQVRFPRRMAD